MKKLFILLIISLSFFGCTQAQNVYNPSIQTVVNKPIGMSGKPVDARSYYYDPANYSYRPYSSITEANNYLQPASVRAGNFPLYIKGVNDSVSIYMYLNGTQNTDLVKIYPNGAFSTADMSALIHDSIVNFNGQLISLSNSLVNKQDKSDSYSKSEINKNIHDSITANKGTFTQVNADWNATSGVSQILNKPVIPTKNSQLTNDVGYINSVPNQSWSSITGKPAFSAVALSGSYSDLVNLPFIPTKVSQLSNDLNLGSINDAISSGATTYSSNKINSLIGAAGGGDMMKSVYDPTNKGADVYNYNNLYNRPTLFSGSYTDLTNKPIIPTNLSQLTNDIGAASINDASASTSTTYSSLKINSLISSAGGGDMLKSVYDPNNVGKNVYDYNNLANKPTIPTNNTQLTNGAGYITTVPAQSWSSITGKPAFSTVATSGSYADLSNKPSIPAAQVSSDWNASSGVSQILNKPTLFSGSYNDLTNKPALFSGSYTDLTNKPTIPTNNNQLTNGAGYYKGSDTISTVSTHSYSDSVSRKTVSDSLSKINLTTGKFVDTISNQNIFGKKTFISGIKTNGFYIGAGNQLESFIISNKDTTTAAGSMVSIGSNVSNAGTGGSVFIGSKAGNYATNPQSNNVVIGNTAGWGSNYSNAIAIGYANTTAGNAVSIGAQSKSGIGGIAIGSSAVAKDSSITIGYNIEGTTPRTVIIGGDYTDSTILKGILKLPKLKSSPNDTLAIGIDGSGKVLTYVRGSGSGGGSGDMLKSIYDPTGKNADVFNYNNLYNKPTLFSGSYTDLTNKPTIPTNNNQLSNGAGYITSVPAQSWSSITGKPTFSTVATSGSYADLSNKPTLFSGSYADLTNKPTIPTNNNQISNGSGYLNNDSLNAHAVSVDATMYLNSTTNKMGVDTSRNGYVPSKYYTDSLFSKANTAGTIPTLDQVLTKGNSSSNGITVGGVIAPSYNIAGGMMDNVAVLGTDADGNIGQSSYKPVTLRINNSLNGKVSATNDTLDLSVNVSGTANVAKDSLVLVDSIGALKTLPVALLPKGYAGGTLSGDGATTTFHFSFTGLTYVINTPISIQMTPESADAAKAQFYVTNITSTGFDVVAAGTVPPTGTGNIKLSFVIY